MSKGNGNSWPKDFKTQMHGYWLKLFYKLIIRDQKHYVRLNTNNIQYIRHYVAAGWQKGGRPLLGYRTDCT